MEVDEDSRDSIIAEGLLWWDTICGGKRLASKTGNLEDKGAFYGKKENKDHTVGLKRGAGKTWKT